MTMRIGIDARFIGRPGGIGRYSEELVRRLASFEKPDELVLFLRDDGVRRLADFTPSNIRKVRAEVPWYTAREQVQMPGIICREQLDMMHYPHWNVPLCSHTPFVVTIHDLLLLEHPTRRASTLDPISYAIKSAAHRIVLSSAIHRARRIIVPSEFVRAQVATHFPSAAAKVVVIPEGVNRPMGGQVSNVDSQLFNILYVGNAYPHKNLNTLLQAFAEVRRRMPDVTLTIAGYDDYFFRQLRDESHRNGLDNAIHFIPSPDDATLEGLYAHASVFVIPSRSEGFGLTPLEAMSRGVPVVAARAGSLPEVLGEAAAYASPDSAADFSRVILDLLEKNDKRSAHIDRGRLQAGRFSWDRMAEATRTVYEAVCPGGKSIRVADPAPSERR